MGNYTSSSGIKKVIAIVVCTTPMIGKSKIFVKRQSTSLSNDDRKKCVHNEKDR